MVTPFEMIAGRESRSQAIRFIGSDIYADIEQRAKALGFELNKGHDLYENFRIADQALRAEKYELIQKYYTVLSKHCNPFVSVEHDIEGVMGLAKEMKDKVQGTAMAIAERHGATCTPINLKSASSIKRKIDTDKCVSYALKDTVRTTIIAEEKEIPEIINELKREGTFLRYKHQGGDGFYGYSGNIVNLRMPNGVVAEIQVNTPEMIYAKEEAAEAILGKELFEVIKKKFGLPHGMGHKYYEMIREPEKYGLTDKLLERMKKKSFEYYSNFTKKK